MARTTLFLIFATTTLLSCSKIEEPEFRALERIQVTNLGLEAISIGFGMTYYNPNNFTVTVKETAANVYLDGTLLGQFSQDSAVDVGQKSDFTVVLSGTIPLSTFLQMNLKDIHKREVSIVADGSTKVGKAGIFIDRKIAYRGKHRLDQIEF
jgi:LEA14-like dessication related protein